MACVCATSDSNSCSHSRHSVLRRGDACTGDTHVNRKSSIAAPNGSLLTLRRNSPAALPAPRKRRASRTSSTCCCAASRCAASAAATAFADAATATAAAAIAVAATMAAAAQAWASISPAVTDCTADVIESRHISAMERRPPEVVSPAWPPT